MTGSCTQTTVLSCLSFKNWKKLNVTNILWFKVVGWYFQTPTEIAMSSGQPMKAHVIDQSLNESNVMIYYLIPPVNHHQLTGQISFHNTMTNCDWPIKSQIQTTSLVSRMFAI